MSDHVDTYPELIIEDAVGVCGVRDDTRTLAEAAAADDAIGRALDLGAGTGYVGLYLAQRGWQVDAVDVSPRAVELVNRNADRTGLRMSVYQSDMFASVPGTFDAIAFNPPMRPDENELTRIATSLLRRSPRVSRALMALLGERLEGSRMPFLTSVVHESRARLRPGGRLVLAISEDETVELAALDGVHLGRVWPIPSMVRQQIAEFRFGDAG